MPQCALIDTFPVFLTYWEQERDEPLETRLAHWEHRYMREWPKLFALQVSDYAGRGTRWQDAAREHVLPFLAERLPAMHRAHGHLLNVVPSLYDAAQRVLGFRTGITCVVYVGLGCGAGWVTRYDDMPAILFGLEMIAECGWTALTSLKGLVAHEMGHVAQNVWRADRNAASQPGPWWQLFCEGFAQRCEHVILGEDTWHEQAGINDEDWLTWCRRHKGWLAAEFIRRVDAREDIRPFFGSWFHIRGRRQCGYYLGHELIRTLERGMSLEDIAVRDDIGECCRSVLMRFSREKD